MSLFQDKIINLLFPKAKNALRAATYNNDDRYHFFFKKNFLWIETHQD